MAQITIGSHVTIANTRHRRGIPSPLEGMSPTTRCKRYHGSFWTKEKVSSSVLDWLSPICGLALCRLPLYMHPGICGTTRRICYLAETTLFHNTNVFTFRNRGRLDKCIQMR